MRNIEKIFILLPFVICLLVGALLASLVFDSGLFSTPLDTKAVGAEGEEVPQTLPEPQATAPSWEVFRGEGYAFEIQYPQSVSPKARINPEALNAGVGVKPGTPVWKFQLEDPALYRGTNLVEASLVIHVRHDQDAEAYCSQFKAGSIFQSPKHKRDELHVVKFNGVPFRKDIVEEGVMGGFYTKISYRAVHKGACYELTELIHTKNVGGAAPGTIEEYDREEVVDRLDGVLETFTFLDTTPTYPERSYPEPKAVAKGVSKASDDNVDGLDVSHWQGDIKWPKVVDAGYVFTFVKATEGVGWTDVKFEYNITEGTNAGMLMGAYHFARPDLDNSGKAEAEYFLSVVGDYLKSGYVRPVLDLEVNDSMTKAELSSWVLEWLGTVKSRTGIEPLIYTNLNYIDNYLTDDVTAYDLWIAYWSCDPETSYDVPPTGKWRDWAFWQYYGPGGCGSNAGYVPGIETNIDLNIFNGLESGLSEYDAASPLWVSLVSDAYYAPVPYYADITADINGDAAGPANFHFWWDCDALGADVSATETSCGALPTPDDGGCLKNEEGMRCVGVENEVQLAEHTYQEIGNYTAKVIVERGAAPPAEDRYKITTHNPLISIFTSPSSPGTGSIHDTYPLKVKVKIKTSLSGALQAEVIEKSSGAAVAQDCQAVGDDFSGKKTFNFGLSETETGEKQYTIWARYRLGGSCPVGDESNEDISKGYTIQWEEHYPQLGVQRPEGVSIKEDGTDRMGLFKKGEKSLIRYLIVNEAVATKLKVTEISLENKANLKDLKVETSLPIEVGPGESKALAVSFVVEDARPFHFDINLTYNYPPDPQYAFTVEGEGFTKIEDVKGDFWAYDHIKALLNSAVSVGCTVNPLRYCPYRDVTRAQMAAFLERGVHGSNFEPPEVALTFDDTEGHWAQFWIEALAKDGITKGCTERLYCPNDPTTRAQMAVFLLRSIHGADYAPPPATGEVFDDVPRDYWASAWIEQLAAEGITKGCEEDRFCPNSAVNRAQMAVFLVRTFGLPMP